MLLYWKGNRNNFSHLGQKKIRKSNLNGSEILLEDSMEQIEFLLKS